MVGSGQVWGWPLCGRSGRSDRKGVRKRIGMIISETELEPLRQGTNPIRIAPDFSALALRKCTDLPHALPDAAKVLNQPNLLGKVVFTGTHEMFSSDWNTPYRAVPVLAFTEIVPMLDQRRRWMALDHQGGGYSCGQTQMVATRFSAFPTIQTLFDDVAKRFHYAKSGWFESADTDTALTRSYEATIARYGLTLRGSGRNHLQESVYPVDADRIATLTNDGEVIELCQASPVLPTILFLAENSD
jgi:hypothetical protein